MDDARAADVAGRPLRLQFTPVIWNPSRAIAARGGDGAVLASAPLPHWLLPVLPLPLGIRAEVYSSARVEGATWTCPTEP
jgi:hypothetical protein